MNRHLAWTIAGTDPSGGAGIQADIVVMHRLDVYPASVITAVIAQNTVGVQRVEPVAADMVQAQLAALRDDVPPRAVKIGALGTAATVRAVAEVLRNLDAFVVCDPVMAATAGGELLEPTGVEALLTDLLPHVDLLTPNLPELSRLSGHPCRSLDEGLEAVPSLLSRGVKSVLIKGGHASGPFSCDVWTDGRQTWWLASPRLDVPHTHGTGCVLSAAIAALAAQGHSVLDAITAAKAYVNQGLRSGGGVGRGRGPLGFGGWPSAPDDVPWADRNTPGERPAMFPDCGIEPLGFYPLVDSADDVAMLAGLGVRTIQLRMKEQTEGGLESEIREAVQHTRQHGARLFINDYAELAQRHGAFGVHLGQEDLDKTDLNILRASGLHLGLSVTGWFELARARAVRPSYVGLGPVFPTGSKVVEVPPLGIDGFARLRRLIPVPVAAIGGVTLERVPELREAGADGFAVISDLSAAADRIERTRAWLTRLRNTMGA